MGAAARPGALGTPGREVAGETATGRPAGPRGQAVVLVGSGQGSEDGQQVGGGGTHGILPAGAEEPLRAGAPVRDEAVAVHHSDGERNPAGHGTLPRNHTFHGLRTLPAARSPTTSSPYAGRRPARGPGREMPPSGAGATGVAGGPHSCPWPRRGRGGRAAGAVRAAAPPAMSRSARAGDGSRRDAPASGRPRWTGARHGLASSRSKTAGTSAGTAGSSHVRGRGRPGHGRTDRDGGGSGVEGSRRTCRQRSRRRTPSRCCRTFRRPAGPAHEWRIRPEHGHRGIRSAPAPRA